MELVVGVSTNSSSGSNHNGINDMGIVTDDAVSQNGLCTKAKGSESAEHYSSVEHNDRPSVSRPGTTLALLLTSVLQKQVSTRELYELMYAEMAEPLLGWCRKRMTTYINGLEPEDLAQRVWLQVWRYLPSFDYTRSDRGSAGGRLVTWVYLIAANTHTDWYRHNVLIKYVPLNIERNTYGSKRYQSGTLDERIDQRRYRASFTDTEPNPEEQVIDQQYAIYVTDACAKVLTNEQYTVLKLRAAGLSYDEIAEVLGTTHSAVKARLYRARVTAGKAIGINVMTE